eukprot:scaffold655_cov105-Isochrysis_galbana.AAC.12
MEEGCHIAHEPRDGRVEHLQVVTHKRKPVAHGAVQDVHGDRRAALRSWVVQKARARSEQLGSAVLRVVPHRPLLQHPCHVGCREERARPCGSGAGQLRPRLPMRREKAAAAHIAAPKMACGLTGRPTRRLHRALGSHPLRQRTQDIDHKRCPGGAVNFP